MNSVRCPVCRQRLAGEDCDGLTAALREHLGREHRIQELCHTPTGGVPPSAVAGSYRPPGAEEAPPPLTEDEKERARRGNRLQEAEMQGEQGSWLPPPGDPPAHGRGVGGRVRRALGPEADRPSAAREEHRGRGPADRPQPGTPHGDHVDCPMCGMHLSGKDEAELSIALREHMIALHEVAPLLASTPRA